ncbi:MAG: hypothetical protein U0744_21580 [Gemmataceae bacterium]
MKKLDDAFQAVHVERRRVQGACNRQRFVDADFQSFQIDGGVRVAVNHQFAGTIRAVVAELGSTLLLAQLTFDVGERVPHILRHIDMLGVSLQPDLGDLIVVAIPQKFGVLVEHLHELAPNTQSPGSAYRLHFGILWLFGHVITRKRKAEFTNWRRLPAPVNWVQYLSDQDQAHSHQWFTPLSSLVSNFHSQVTE